MANTLAIAHDQGTTLTRNLTIKSDEVTPIDLTGYTFLGQARLAYIQATPSFSFQFTIANQSTNIGEVAMTLLPASTSSLSIDRPTVYKYDVEMTTPGGAITRLFQGEITISPEVTK